MSLQLKNRIQSSSSSATITVFTIRDSGHRYPGALLNDTRTASHLQNLRHVPRDSFLKLTGLSVQRFEFFVKFFKLFLEVLVTDGFAWSDTDITAGIKGPALRLDFL